MKALICRWTLSLLIALGLAAALTAQSSPGPIRLEVDLREAPHRVLHSRLTIPVSPGPLTLHYPQWIPGEHGPTGPISDLTGIRFTANGQRLEWQRDPLEMFRFRVEVPEDAGSLEVALDYLTPSEAGIFTHGPAASARLAVLSWNTVLLYPAGSPADELTYEATLELPAGWQFGTALPVARREGDTVSFQPVCLTTLVDSPVAAGIHYRAVELTGDGTPPHRIHVVADSAAALAMRPETVAAYRRLVAEALELFGAYHYREYHFLLTLSDHVESFGLEHHESSDNRLPERTLVDPDLLVHRATLLPHEFAHSWNGKYRRPAGLATPDYQTPMVDDLLWVYEGLTAYLHQILTTRSGLWTAEHSRESLALSAAGLDHRPGRSWRPLGDTTRAARILFRTREEGSAWRRGVDFYDEGVLIWLEADVLIRRQSAGRRSLDDFFRLFHGGTSGPPELRSFELDDLLAALEQILPYDWRSFFAARIDAITPHPPLGGITQGGWKLVYTEAMNEHLRVSENAEQVTDLRFSLGFRIQDQSGHPDHGRLLDLIPDSPAARAGLAPGMKLIAVNGRRWSTQVLRDALRAGSGPLELLTENAEYFQIYRIDEHPGERYPHLVRDEAQPDVLSDVLRARTVP